MSARKLAQTNGIRLAYAERGQGEPLVLIMGLGADGDVWEPHVAAYERRFRCIVADNRGAGESDKPAGPYTTAMMADDTAGLIRGLGLARVRVAGISMGGAIAQELALRHPQLVRSMVLACTWARCDEYTKRVFQHFARVRAAAPPIDFVQLLQLWIWSPPHTNAHAAELRQLQEEALGRPGMPQQAFEAQCQACVTHDTVADLSRIAAPTLLTVGDRDVFTPPAFTAELHLGIRGSEVKIFPGAGHVHHFEAVEEWNTLTTDWLLRN